MTDYYDIRPVCLGLNAYHSPFWALERDGALVDGFPSSWKIIVPKSGKRLRQSVERLAWYFKREFTYDFVQYSADENTDDRDRVWCYVHSVNTDHPVLGAAVFRWRKWTDAPAGLSLAWVWLHTYIRRKGVLKEIWPHWRRMYGPFHIEGPISPSMQAFLKVADAPQS